MAQTFLILNFLNSFYMTTTVPSPSRPLPNPVHSSEKVRPSMRNQQSLAYEIEAGPSPSPFPYQNWALYPTTGDGLQKTISCTKDKSWSHCQGFHKKTKSHDFRPCSEESSFSNAVPCRLFSTSSYGFYDRAII